MVQYQRLCRSPRRRDPARERPRGAVLGPGFGRWDVSLARVIKINEALKFQFRGEVFNVFNHTNPLVVNATRTSAQSDRSPARVTRGRFNLG